MCDVHLIELRREYGVAWMGRCSSCAQPIQGSCDVVYGELDDGSPGVQVLRYHPDCLEGIEDDGVDEGNGCFQYGTVSEVISA